MLSVYVRHSNQCRDRDKGRAWRRCKCRKWLHCQETGKRFSAKTRSWELAAQRAAQMMSAPERGILIEEKAKGYVEAMRTLGIGEDHQSFNRLWIVERLVPALAAQGVTRLHQVETSHIEEWRSKWSELYPIRSLISFRVVTSGISSFFHYCAKNRWISYNPCSALRPIRATDAPVEYFTEEEVDAIITSVGEYAARTNGFTEADKNRSRTRLVAFIHLLRWSGLRILDAAILARSMLEKSHSGWILRVPMQKAKRQRGIAIIPIPSWLGIELAALPNSNMKYFFWSGNGKPESASQIWRWRLGNVFKIANLGKRCHPHMFRDTFAICYLSKGMDLATVSKMLGHTSIKTTEKHYAHWAKSREDRLVEEVRVAWG